MKRPDNTNVYMVNISKVLHQATADDRAKGKDWYGEARDEAQDIADATGLSLMRVCGIIAALSPRNKWLRNLADARAVCEQRGVGYSCATFQANVDKAHNILNMPHSDSLRWDIEQELHGKKVVAFFNNIFDPTSQRVTVDVHMQLAALGRYLPENERPGLTDKIYREIESAIKTIAMNNGMMPHEVQATAWLTWKGMNS